MGASDLGVGVGEGDADPVVDAAVEAAGVADAGFVGSAVLLPQADRIRMKISPIIVKAIFLFGFMVDMVLTPYSLPLQGTILRSSHRIKASMHTAINPIRMIPTKIISLLKNLLASSTIQPTPDTAATISAATKVV
ncbi:hypothetical protein D3C73_436710 [compost metagenome]